MFDKLLLPHLQKAHPACSIESAPWSSSQKEARIIDALEPVLNQHRLVVDPRVIQADYESTLGYTPEDQNKYRLMYQMTRITRDRGSLAKDDRVDALHMAVKWFTDRLDQDTKKAAEGAREAALMRELEQFVEDHGAGSRVTVEWSGGVDTMVVDGGDGFARL